MFVLALLPIALILILMVGFRWGAARAGAVGYLSALAVALLAFGAGPLLLAYAHTKALLLTLDVLLIVWTAFALFRVTEEAGAIEDLSRALPRLTPNRGMQALLIGWAFASFLQGVGGFGVPVAVIAPILVGLEFSPLAAVVLPSIGHSWAVTFGSLGSSFQALTAASGLAGELLAAPSALFLGVAGIGAGLMVAHAAAGWRGLGRLGVAVLVMGSSMGAAQYLLATAGLWNMAAFGAGLAGLSVGLLLARLSGRAQAERPPVQAASLGLALAGYAILVAVTLLVQLVPWVREILGGVEIAIQFPELSTARGHITPAETGRRIALFRHAGAILAYTSLLAYLVYRRAGRYRPGASGRILRGTWARVGSSSVGITSMVAMAVVMSHAGMTDALALGLARAAGQGFPWAAPWIGALGAFMTGSNTNSNVVFTVLQLRTAELLGYSTAAILAGQTAGGALGSVIAPTKVVVGASTAGMGGREGEVMRALLVYTGLLVLLVSLLTAVAV